MNELIIIAITLVASAFFSGMEIAFVSSDKLRLELDKSKKLINVQIINQFLKTPGQFIATMLVGNNIALVVYSLSFAGVLDRLMSGFAMDESLHLIIQTIISTLIILIVAEFLPNETRLGPGSRHEAPPGRWRRFVGGRSRGCPGRSLG